METELNLLRKILLLIELKIRRLYRLLCLAVKNIGHLRTKLSLIRVLNRRNRINLELSSLLLRN